MMSALEPPEGEVFDTSALRDRVTIMLLFEQVVQLDQIRAVWPLWRAMQEARAVVPLWRLLAAHASVDSEAVFEMAARIYSFERVDIPSPYNVLRFVREHRHALTADQWDRMYELSLVPVDIEYPTCDRAEWVFASYDPGQPAVKDFLDELDVIHRVCYAPYSVVEEVLQTVFPDRDAAGSVLGPADVFGVPVTETMREAPADESASHTTLLKALERALTEIVRGGLSKAYFIPNAASEIEVHIRRDETVRHEDTWSDISARSFLTFVRRRIIGAGGGEKDEAMKKDIYRWIDGQRRRFRIQLLAVHDPAHGIDTTVISVKYIV